MSENGSSKRGPTTTEVSVNWEGLKRFLGWHGSIDELKKTELDHLGAARASEDSGAGK